MRTLRRDKKNGFTLVEILIVAVIIAILAGLTIPLLFRQIHKAQEAEATSNLGGIRSAELNLQALSGKFAAAEDAAAIRLALGLEVGGHFYSYKVIDVTDENFLAVATPLGPLENWLQEFSINKDGFVGYNPYSGGGSGGGSSGGGSSGGGSSGGGVVGGLNQGAFGGGLTIISSGGGSYGYGTTRGSVGGEALPIVVYPPLDPLMAFPTNATVTSNNGWLHIGWNPGTTGDASIVYRASKVDGVIGDFEILEGTPNEGWSDQVANDSEYCYQITSYNTQTEQQSQPSSPVVCGAASATSRAALAVDATKEVLGESLGDIAGVDGVSSGSQIAAWVETEGFPVLYGKTNCSESGGRRLCTEAYFDPNTNTLVIGLDLLNNEQQSAVVLSHEGTHAIWRADYNEYLAGVPERPQYGTPPDPPGGVRSSNSIDQEYAASLTNLQVYYDLKKNHGMPSVSRWDSILPKFLDTVTGSPLASDSEAKIYLRSMYTDLPEY